MNRSKAVKRFGNLAYIFSAALMIASLLANVLPARIAQATPPDQDLQLNLSHIYCYTGDNPSLEGLVEIHFVLLNVPDGIHRARSTYRECLALF
jgi:hypothetical protein